MGARPGVTCSYALSLLFWTLPSLLLDLWGWQPFLSQPGLLLYNAQYLKGSLDYELIKDRKHASLPLAFPAPGTWHLAQHMQDTKQGLGP